ncbi:MAG: acylphosphatase [Pseudomonadota bacterium]
MPSPSHRAHHLIVRGALDSASFLPWVAQHSRRLGLRCQTLSADAREAVFRVEGHPEMIDALEVGCLLGPFDVWIDTVTKTHAASEP